ncbi:unnamed protein product, partial [Rotaria sp. Silwood2]
YDCHRIHGLSNPTSANHIIDDDLLVRLRAALAADAFDRNRLLALGIDAGLGSGILDNAFHYFLTNGLSDFLDGNNNSFFDFLNSLNAIGFDLNRFLDRLNVALLNNDLFNERFDRLGNLGYDLDGNVCRG